MLAGQSNPQGPQAAGKIPSWFESSVELPWEIELGRLLG